MSTARLVTHDSPGSALDQLDRAHRRVVAARLRAGFASERYDREFAAALSRGADGVSGGCLHECETAKAELAQAEQGIRAAFLAYGLAIGVVDDAGSIG